jgi:hypothetical protein
MDFAPGKVPAGVRADVFDNKYSLRNGDIENGQLATVELDERTLPRAATRNWNKLNEGRFQCSAMKNPARGELYEPPPGDLRQRCRKCGGSP